jgi:hypothetical protein
VKKGCSGLEFDFNGVDWLDMPEEVSFTLGRCLLRKADAEN